MKMRSRAEDPNISLRVIEKIKDKCKDYYRETMGIDTKVLMNSLIKDIMLFKKDCLVAAELAQQYILKSIEKHPKTAKHESFRMSFEIDRLNEENESLKQEISELKAEFTKISSQKDEYDLLPQQLITNSIQMDSNNEELEELRQRMSEYESSMIILEMKYENTVSDLENERKTNQGIIAKLQASLNESNVKKEALEKKIKDSMSNYTRFLFKKNLEYKECQTDIKNLIIEHIGVINVQKNNEYDIGQLSRLSITDSEIFNITGMNNLDIFSSNTIWVPPTIPILKIQNFSVFNQAC
ncbi:hypothetical protein SteCoe_21780 [Stentor coeruleus]|uniref:Uncharacterized protein n=1 Tax=Stentor coeruleus TaxID=5963 RepID=A0A1R2BNQ0_9CILI|nr:hypothetical protein SteCoe_21780 [Stentor coeruleus]